MSDSGLIPHMFSRAHDRNAWSISIGLCIKVRTAQPPPRSCIVDPWKAPYCSVAATDSTADSTGCTRFFGGLVFEGPLVWFFFGVLNLVVSADGEVPCSRAVICCFPALPDMIGRRMGVELVC